MTVGRSFKQENQSEHDRLDRLISEGFASVDRQIAKVNQRIGLAGLVVTLATVGLPVWANVRASESTLAVKATAVETTRTEFRALTREWQWEYREECRARDVELTRIAEQAAAKAIEKAAK